MRGVPVPRRLVDFVQRHPGLALVLGCLYLLSPIDLVPEALTGVVGFADDLVVVLLMTLPALFKERRRNRRAGKDVATRAVR